MATSAQTLSQIINTVCKIHELDEKEVLNLLAENELLPKKLIPKDSKGASKFASKQAEELASKSNIIPEGEGSGKDGKFTLTDIKKLMEKPTKEKLLISPTAITFANENGINIADVTGTGKDGRILLKDVEALIAKEEEPKDKIEISPSAINEANKAKIDEDVLKTIPGTGKDGRILLKDVKKYLSESDKSGSDSDEEKEEE
jgi:pyruvate/2-oxoglutarate dehydrogenase complex dihydrolipoamide acyltransferase (E2) component